MEEKKYKKTLNIYKPTSNKTGGACRFKLEPDIETIFMEVAKQTGEIKSKNIFNWENKVIIALKINDLFLWRTGLLEDGKVNIVHKIERDGNKKMSNISIDKGNRSGFYMVVNQKTESSNQNIGVNISKGEMKCLDDIFTMFIYKVYC